MSVYFDKDKKRWRFSFNRVITRHRIRATKLLPQGWGADRRDRFDRVESARLYAEAKGLEQPEPLISEAVRLYVDHKVPELHNGLKCARELALMRRYYKGKTFSDLSGVSMKYREDHEVKLRPGTIKNRLSYLRAACRYAWKYHKLGDRNHVPGADILMPTVSNDRDVQIPFDRIQELLRELRKIDEESCAVFTLAFRIGSRWISGVHKREPEDVERIGDDVWLRVGITKNGTPRMKWVHPDAHWALDYLPFEWGDSYYRDRFNLARTKVGLDHLSADLKALRPHDMRHVIGTDIRKRGGSLDDVGAALDHDSHQASQRYAHITPDHVKRVLAGIGKAKKVHTRRRRHRHKRAA